MIHELKILPQYFEVVLEGAKTFELRKNDRGFEVGDKIILKEYKPFEDGVLKGQYGLYTGREIEKEISYILNESPCGLEEEHCVLALKQEGIILKNIDLTGIPPIEQARKVEEERQEFIYAFDDYINNKSEENKIHVMDELLDEFQTKLGLLEKEGIKAEEVQAYYNTWVKKLDKRPRQKKCNKCKMYNQCFSTKDFSEDKAKECKCYEEMED